LSVVVAARPPKSGWPSWIVPELRLTKEVEKPPKSGWLCRIVPELGLTREVVLVVVDSCRSADSANERDEPRVICTCLFTWAQVFPCSYEHRIGYCGKFCYITYRGLGPLPKRSNLFEYISAMGEKRLNALIRLSPRTCDSLSIHVM